MSEKEKTASIWISWDNCRKILKAKTEMMKNDGHARNPHSVVRELIELWKKHQT